MNNDRYDIFDYCLVNSRIHNLNFFYKIVSIILVLFCLVVADSIIDMFVINFFILMLMLWSDVKIGMYIKNLYYIKFILFGIFLFTSVIYLNVVVGLFWMIKFIDFVLYLSIIMMTTSVYDVIYGIDKLLRPFRNIIDVNDISIKIGCFMKFFTFLYSENKRISNSKRIRGVRFREMGLVDKIDYVVRGIFPLYSSVVERINKLINVMHVKNFGIVSIGNNYRLNKWGKTDTILLVINVLVIVITFVY